MSKGDLKVVFTIDVEDNRKSVPYLIDGDLREFGIDENCGLDYILDIYKKFGFKAVFFVNIYENSFYDEGYIPKILKKIYKMGHEIGLHAHVLPSETTESINTKHPLLLDVSEQETIYKYGMDYIEKHIGKRPISFRAGAYIINDNLFEALSNVGIRIDSSMYYGHRTNDALSFYAGSENRVFMTRGVLEIPIFDVWRGNRWTKLDINAMSENEIINTLEIMKNSERYDIAQIMMHSFSYLDQGSRRADQKEIIKHNDKYIYGENTKTKSRFERICTYLKETKGYEVVTFEEYYTYCNQTNYTDGNSLVYLKDKDLALSSEDVFVYNNGTAIVFLIKKPDDDLVYGWKIVSVDNKDEEYISGQGKKYRRYVFNIPEDMNGEYKVYVSIGRENEDISRYLSFNYYNIYIDKGVCEYHYKVLSDVKYYNNQKYISGTSIGYQEMKANPLPDDVNESIYMYCSLRAYTDPTSRDLESTIEEIRRFGLNIPVDWNLPETEYRHRFRIPAFKCFVGALKDYKKTRSKDTGRMLYDYIYDFSVRHKEYDKEYINIWHDESASMRLLFFCAALRELTLDYSRDVPSVVAGTMKHHADLMTKDWFYKQKHNHGLHQDGALIVYELLFGAGDEAEQRIELAKKRIIEYMEFAFTKEGIHKEHSPIYVRDVLSDLYCLSKIMRYKDAVFSRKISEYIIDAMTSVYYFQKPDHTIPTLGDTEKTDVRKVFTLFDVESDIIDWFKGKGNKEVKPSVFKVYPAGGYAVFRSSWDFKKDTTWVMFCAATHSSAHKHGDDLHVMVYHKGDLFVDGGFAGYSYLENQCAYAYSGYAHNVLVINDEAFPVKKGKSGFQAIYPEALNTAITEYDITEDVAYVKGYQNRFKGIEQYRSLRYEKGNSLIQIEDSIVSDREYNGKLLWHTAEGVELIIADNKVSCLRDGYTVADITIESSAEFSIYEMNQYPFVGWYFEDRYKKANGKLFVIDFKGCPGEVQIQMDVALM